MKTNRCKKGIRVTSVMLGSLLLAFVIILLLSATSSASTASNIRYVAPGGNCGGASPCYASLQDAADAADDRDEIRVAEGTYTDLNSSYDGKHKALLVLYRERKSLTLRGGYSLSDWENSKPEEHPTILDAQGQGAVIYYACQNCFKSLTIDGFNITGGYASEAVTGVEHGAGISFDSSDPVVIKNCKIYNNVAEDGKSAGIYLESSREVTIENNVIRDNTGKGVFLLYPGEDFSRTIL